ncbi:MAG: phosphoribosylformylglycinamidine synthase subunit PurQ [Planctomycetota bacterium]
MADVLKKDQPLALVLRAAGTNCDRETVHALELAGARVESIHVNALSKDPSILQDAGLLAFPGGFTFGDDVASGAVLAHILEERLRPMLQQFVDRGGLVIGICNGFQVLVRLGLLPGVTGRAAMLWNRSGRFEDRWVHLAAGDVESPWFAPGQNYFVPVAHAEGRFEWFPKQPGESFPASQVAFRYRDAEGGVPEYPDDPNGSHETIAGVLSPDGNVLGMMPHPERFVRPEHHPFWMRLREDGRIPQEEDLPVPLGLDIFRRAIDHLRSRQGNLVGEGGTR